jgi:hypothetical protein
MREVFIPDIHECPLLCKRIADAPVEGVDWVVTISHYTYLHHTAEFLLRS